jgi:hypothetical protein
VKINASFVDVPTGVRCVHAPMHIKTLFIDDTIVLLATLEHENDDATTTLDNALLGAVRARLEIVVDGAEVSNVYQCAIVIHRLFVCVSL